MRSAWQLPYGKHLLNGIYNYHYYLSFEEVIERCQIVDSQFSKMACYLPLIFLFSTSL